MSGCQKILGIETDRLTPADLEIRCSPKPEETKSGTTWVNLGFTSLEFLLYQNGRIGYQWVTSPTVRGNHGLGEYSGHALKLVLLDATANQPVFTSDIFDPDQLTLQEGDFNGMCGNVYERGLLLVDPRFGWLSVLAEEKTSEPFPLSDPLN